VVVGIRLAGPPLDDSDAVAAGLSSVPPPAGDPGPLSEQPLTNSREANTRPAAAVART
jgi:hypothetical protein